MDEEKTPEESKGSEDNSSEGLQSKAITELDRADQIAQMQKRENDRREQLIIREEKLAAINKVGGSTEGRTEPEKKEETPQEYKDRVLKGDLNS
tara:strand:- start:5158 stop:5439 length:282 start_codon:yes stop_codon:yes gene_type:complete